MIKACLVTLLSYWRRNPLQLFSFLAGLALATGLWSGVQAINAEARASYDAAAQTLGDGQYDQLLPRQGESISLQSYVALRRAGWLVSPIIEGQFGDVRVIGLDALTAPSGLSGMAQADFTSMTAGDTSLFANAETAALLQGASDVQVSPNVAPGIAIGDIGVVQHFLQRNDFSRLIILPEQPRVQQNLREAAPGLRRQPAQQTADLSQLTDSFHLNLTAFGLLSFAVGIFIVHSTIGLAFEQRRAMIRTLRSLGVPLKSLLAMIVLEMLGLALVGASIGIVLGYLVASFLLPDVAATLQGLYGAEISGSLQLRWDWWLSGLLIAVLGTGVALAGRIWQIWKMPLLASVHPRAWAMAGARKDHWLGVSAMALLGAAAFLLFIGDGLVAAFALLGCLLIGAALLLPVLVSRVLRLAQSQSNSVISSWFWADTRQQLPGLSLALMALLLAISANIGVSTMVSSFRLTFTEFLDQRLAPELFIEVETKEQSTALEAFLRKKRLEVLPLSTANQSVLGQRARFFGIRVGPTYRKHWAFLDAAPNVWDRVQDGSAVILNEQLARRTDTWVGDEVNLGENLARPVAGVVGDYGNPIGQVVMAQTLFERLFSDRFPAQFGVRTSDAQILRSELIEEVGLSGNTIIDQAAIKSMSIRVFERTFTVTQALNILTLGVAGFAILLSLLTLADLRLPQLAPVWALGLTRRRLGQLELIRAVVLAAVVFLCAVPLGLALAWVLLSMVNVEAFGWQLPMFFFPADYVLLGAYALAASVLAAAWPAFRLMQIPPASLLKVFANER